MKKLVLMMSVVGLLGLSGTQAAAGPLLIQPPVWSGNNTNVGISWTSQTVNGTGTGFVAFDDFSFVSATTINQATWLGIYLDATNPTNLTNGAPNTSRWDIVFDSDGGTGVPTGLITADGNTPVQRTTLGTGFFGGNLVTVYQFTAQFPDFVAAPGVRYWFAPISVGPTFSPLFSWIQGSGGNGSSAQVTLDNFNPVGDDPRQGDRALSLGTVPEPATIGLLALGLGAAMATRRRRVS